MNVTARIGADAPPGGSVRDWVDLHAAERPDAVSHVVCETGERITWAGLRDMARDFAGRAAGAGARPGESLAIMVPNGKAAIACVFGALYGGFRVTPINLVAGPAGVGYALWHSEARLVFVSDANRALLDEALACHPANPQVVPVPDGGMPDWSGYPSGDCPPAPTAQADGLLMYTSGTTGTPKGVLHTHASLLAGGWTPAIAHELGPDDRALCILPHYHINGLCVTLMGPLVSGGSSALVARFSASRFWQQARDAEVTWFSAVPTIISHLLHGDEANGPDAETVARIRFGRSASAPLAPDVQQAFENRFSIPIVETMGLTETAAQILSHPLPPGDRRIGSPGVAVGNEVCVRDAGGGECARGEVGEVMVRGPNVMRGYLKNPEATAEALTADGWLHTGDLGRMDEDGYVFITGRLKELIIKGGENIAPREIDEALYSHPDVIEAAAFARPCTRYGQTVEAAVRLRPESAIDAAALVDLCRTRVGPFKAPDCVHLLDSLPKGPSGKIQRLKLAEMTTPGS